MIVLVFVLLGEAIMSGLIVVGYDDHTIRLGYGLGILLGMSWAGITFYGPGVNYEVQSMWSKTTQFRCESCEERIRQQNTSRINN